MKKYNCLFFDMDGTFADSRDFHVKAFHRFFSRYDQEMDMETIRNGMGMTIKIIFDNLGIPEDRHVDLFHKLCRFYSGEADDLIAGIKVAGGFRDVLQSLKKEGYKIAVITNSVQHLVDRILVIHGLRDCFDLVAGAELQFLDKEERCLGAMESLHAKKSGILYIGDAEWDFRIANALGFDSCFAYTDISWCEDYEYTMNVLRPAYMIRTLEELPVLLNRQAGPAPEKQPLYLTNKA